MIAAASSGAIVQRAVYRLADERRGAYRLVMKPAIQHVLGFVILATGIGCERSTSLTVPDNYRTIQAAIDAAGPGETVRVRPGIYHESVHIDKNVSLQGVDRDGVIIQSNDAAVSTLSIRNGQGLSIESITFLGAKGGNPDKSAPVVNLVATNAAIRNCTVQSGAATGVYMHSASGSVSNCLVSGNGTSGIVVTGRSKDVTLTGNQCNNNGGSGIYFSNGGNATVEKNICADNVWYGIVAAGEGVNPVLVANECRGSGYCGIYIGEGAGGTVSKNICGSNVWHGVSIISKECSVTVTENTCDDNARDGIYIGDGACCTVRDNHAASNANGIVIAYATAAAEIRGNTCINNSYDGIQTPTGHRCQIVENTLKGNNQFLSAQMLIDLLESEKFDELESIAADIRKSRKRDANGGWVLEYYYDYLSNRGFEEGSAAAMKQLGQIEAWQEAKPKSVTPKIVRAKLCMLNAWQVRGNEYAHKIPEANMRQMNVHVRYALKLLGEAADLEQSDPELFATFILAGRMIGIDDEEMLEAFELGVRADSNYVPLYRAYASTLQPQWGGKPGEIEAFATKSLELMDEDERDAVYAEIVFATYWHNGPKALHLEHKFDLRRALRGFEHLCKRFPESRYYLNKYCRFACICHQSTVARELFEKIGNDWDSSVWKEQKEFDGWREYASNHQEWEKPDWWPKDYEF